MDKEKIGGVDSIGFMLIPSGSNSMHTKKNHILSYFFESWWVQSKESGKFTQGCDNYWDESNFFHSNPTRYSELVFYELIFFV